MTGSDDEWLYPNADGQDSQTVPLSRRHLLAGSAAAGGLATAGCTGSDSDDEETTTTGQQSTVLVFNTGDRTVSVLDPATESVVATRQLGVTSSFPSNQFTPSLTDSGGDPLWLNVGNGVRAHAAGTLSELARFETGSGANWLEQTPDGGSLIVSAREPTHRQFRIDSNPESDAFGSVTAEIDRTPEGGRGNNEGPGPCDVTIHPEGEYAFVPDLFGDTLTVLRIDPFEIATQVDVEPVGEAAAAPWMGTASWDGETLLVEHNEGSDGTESGLGSGALTSEIGPESAFGYVFTPGTEDVSVIDLEAASVVDRLDLGGQAFVGTWDTDREKLFVPIQTENEVAVIDHERREITDRIQVGDAPYGATASTVRPDEADSVEERLTRLSAAADDTGTTYCIGNCACGHEL
jgi:DNA-binding beta-propeller fold protein YncE